MALPSHRGSAIANSRPISRYAASRWPIRQVSRTPAIDLRFGGIAEPKLDACSDLILQGGPQFGPARRRDDNVDAERKTLSGNRSDQTLEAIELLAQRRPAIDDQKHVAERILGDSWITG